jgi:hypothetical protein
VEGRSTMGRGSGRGSGPRLTTLVAMHARVLALAGRVASASAFAPAALPTRAPRKRPASPRAIFARIGSPGCLPALRCEM